MVPHVASLKVTTYVLISALLRPPSPNLPLTFTLRVNSNLALDLDVQGSRLLEKS